MNSKRRYLVTNVLGSFYVNPINDNEIVYEYKKSEGTVYFKKELKTKLIFSNNAKLSINDFDYFYQFENNKVNNCIDFEILIQAKCGGIWVNEHAGEFSLNDADWDLDRCTLSLSVKTKDTYTCIDKLKKEQYNILEIPTKKQIASFTWYKDLEYYVCYPSTPINCPSPPGVNPATWKYLHAENSFVYHVPTNIGSCLTSSVNFRLMYRQFAFTACNGGTPIPPSGSGWALESNTCNVNGLSKWVRIATLPSVGPAPSSSPFFNNDILVGYADIHGASPLMPYTKNIAVTTTPQSNLIEGYSFAQISGLVNTGSDWFYTILNNPNSTYNWSYVATGTGIMNIVSGQGTNQLRANFTGAFTGNICEITLAETHGNGYVSNQSFFVTIYSANIALGVSIDGYLNIDDVNFYEFKVPKYPVSTDIAVTVTANTWTCPNTNNSGANADGQKFFQGTGVTSPTSNTMNVGFQIISTGAGTITVSSTYSVDVNEKPVSIKLKGIDEIYPNEPNLSYGALVPNLNNFIFRQGTIRLNPLFSQQSIIFTNNVLGTVCLSMQSFPNGSYQALYVDYTKNLGYFLYKFLNLDITNTASPWFPNGNIYTQSFVNNQLLLKQVFEFILLTKFNCNINSVISDFFEWNPQGDAPNYIAGNNYVTNFINRLTYLTIGSTSDVVYGVGSAPATILKVTLEQLEKMLLIAFNCYWFIDNNNNFRIEHDSYFKRFTNYSAISVTNFPFNKAKNKYTYDKTVIPIRETFTFNLSVFEDNLGVPIEYSSLCTNQDSSNNKLRYELDKFTTDLDGVAFVPDKYDLRGFFLTSNFGVNFSQTTYIVNNETGLLTGQIRSNNHLSWANLLYNYHRYNRPLPSGLMNNILTNFITTKKTKTQKEIILKNCCDDDFNFVLSLVKTELGNGEVSEYEENKKTGTIKLTLLQ